MAEQAEPEQAVTPPPAAADHHAVRGPFEPLVERGGQTSGAASSAADRPANDADGRPYEFPGLDDDEPLDRPTPRLTGSRSCTGPRPRSPRRASTPTSTSYLNGSGD